MTIFDKSARPSANQVITALLALALCATPIPPAFGQSTDGGGESEASDGGAGEASGALSQSQQGLSSSVTQSSVLNLRAVRGECAGYDPVYRIDCLRQGFAAVAQRIPRRGEYRQIRAIIEEANRDLGSVVANNADARAPKQASRGNARFKQRRTYTAVKRQTLGRAMQQAQRVVQQAETKLLRSSENSEKRFQHYQQVATAVGSTKVLLRSA